MAGKCLTSLCHALSGLFPHPPQGPRPHPSSSVNIWFTSCPESILPARSPKAASYWLTAVSTCIFTHPSICHLFSRWPDQWRSSEIMLTRGIDQGLGCCLVCGRRRCVLLDMRPGH